MLLENEKIERKIVNEDVQKYFLKILVILLKILSKFYQSKD